MKEALARLREKAAQEAAKQPTRQEVAKHARRLCVVPEAKRFSKRQPFAALRPCLCCKTPFKSQGPGNRLCARCRGISVGPFEI